MATMYSVPVCLFVYKRLSTFRNLIASLLQNELAQSTDIHIFSDAAAGEKDIESVNEVREFIIGIKGFKSVSVYLSEKNKGLAKSIIEGVTMIVHKEGRVIVLEDDLVVSANFLNFMNDALSAFENTPKIFAVSGYSSPIKTTADRDVYFTKRSSSWGWATWADRWDKIDWAVSDFEQFTRNSLQQRDFNKMGSDLTHMLRKQMDGKINSWAIRWVYHQFKHDLYTVFPVKSKVCNNGFHEGASNTLKNNESRFSTELDKSAKKKFDFSQQPYLDKNVIRQFVNPYSIKTRTIYKLKELLHL